MCFLNMITRCRKIEKMVDCRDHQRERVKGQYEILEGHIIKWMLSKELSIALESHQDFWSNRPLFSDGYCEWPCWIGFENLQITLQDNPNVVFLSALTWIQWLNNLSPNKVSPFQTCIASSECAVQTNGLYSPPGQGPGPGHGLTHPPAAWFTSLHRPHYRNLDLSRRGFQVEIYDLDKPLARNTDFSAQEGLNINGHDVRNQKTEENQNHSQQFDVRNSDRNLDAAIGIGDQNKSVVLSKTPITSDNDFKRSRLVKSASSDGILGQNSVSAPDYLMPGRNTQELCFSTESLESLLPELAPVELPGKRTRYWILQILNDVFFNYQSKGFIYKVLFWCQAHPASSFSVAHSNSHLVQIQTKLT